jgi:hypothetical protein
MEYITHFFSDHQRGLLESYLNEINHNPKDYNRENKPLTAAIFFQGFDTWYRKGCPKSEDKNQSDDGSLFVDEFEKFCQKYEKETKMSQKRMLGLIKSICRSHVYGDYSHTVDGYLLALSDLSLELVRNEIEAIPKRKFNNCGGPVSRKLIKRFLEETK